LSHNSVFIIKKAMVFRKKKQAAATPVDKIESWKAADPTDKRELKIYVDNGCCDGLTPIDVMNKFPQFRDYATKTFSSALQTARKSHNKCIHDRHRAGFEGFSGLHPRNNLGSIAEGKECASVDDDDWERVSAVTEGTSFDSMADVESSFKSMKLTVRDANDDKKKFVRIDTTTHHICAKDVWEDSKGNRRISVQLETDSANYKSDKIRVSTDGWEIVNYTELSDNITDPKRALDYTDLDPTSAEAAWHPRIIARKKTIAQARGRDPNHAKVVVKSRYRLPFKVRHVFATKADGDPFFHGKKTIMYQDGETHHHIELVEMKRDGYDPEKIRLCTKLVGGLLMPAMQVSLRVSSLEDRLQWRRMALPRLAMQNQLFLMMVMMVTGPPVHQSSARPRSRSALNLRMLQSLRAIGVMKMKTLSCAACDLE